MKRLGFGKFVGMSALLGTLVVAVGCADESAATDGADEGQGVAQAPIEEQRAEGDRAVASREKRARKDRRLEGDRPDGERGPRGDHGQMGKMGKGGHGPEKLLFTAMKELDLTDAQRAAIEGAIDGLRDARPEPREDGASPFAKVAEQVRAGRVDVAALEAELEKHRPDMAAHRAATAKALQTLHATLTPDQRRQLVDAVGARMDAHAEKDAEREGEGFEGRAGKHAAGPIGHMLRGLDLTDAQQAQVDAALDGLAPTEAERTAFHAKREAMKQDMRAKLETFAADRFDAAAAMPEKDRGMKPDHHARMAKALAAIVPVLDEAQRAALADRLEEGPKGLGGKGRRGPRGGR